MEVSVQLLIECGKCVVRTGDHNIASRSASLATNGLRLGSSIWLIAHNAAHTHTPTVTPHTPNVHNIILSHTL